MQKPWKDTGISLTLIKLPENFPKHFFQLAMLSSQFFYQVTFVIVG